MSKNGILIFCTILVIGILIFTFIMEFAMKKWKCVDNNCIKVLGGDYSYKDKCEDTCKSNTESDSEKNHELVVSPTIKKDIVVKPVSDYGYPYNYGYAYYYGAPYYNSLYPYAYNSLYHYGYDSECNGSGCGNGGYNHHKHIHHRGKGHKRKSKRKSPNKKSRNKKGIGRSKSRYPIRSRSGRRKSPNRRMR